MERASFHLYALCVFWYAIAKFKNYNLQKDQWLYLTNKTTYFYATGFNMARLLDKLGIEYKSRLFKDGKITLKNILKKNHELFAYQNYLVFLKNPIGDR